MTTKEEKCALRKKVGAKMRAARGKLTLAQYCAIFNVTEPVGITLAPSLLSRYERGLVSCPGEKLCKMMEIKP